MEKRPTAEQLAKYKSNAKNESFSADVRAKFQSIVDKFENVGEAVVDAVEQKKERKPRTTKTTTKVVATKQTKSDIESAKAEIKKRTGKTEEECESIVEEYRSLRAKSQERKKKEVQATEDNKDRVSKLKKDDKIISGTNEKTADAVIETTTKDVSEKIVKELDKIEQKAEVEAKKEVEKEMPKESATEKKKAVAEKTEEKVKAIVKIKTKNILVDTSDLLTSIAETLGKFDKDSQKVFLIKLRSDIDKLLTKFSLGGDTMGATQTFNITQSNMSSSSVNPTMFGGGGGVDEKLYSVMAKRVGVMMDISDNPMTKADAQNWIKDNRINEIWSKVEIVPYPQNSFLPIALDEKLSYEDFSETLRDYDKIDAYTGQTTTGMEMFYLPSGHSYLGKKFKHKNKRKAYNEYLESSKFNDGGGVGGNRAKSITHNINGKDRKFPIKDAWRREHNSYNESENYEIPLNKRKLAKGGMTEHALKVGDTIMGEDRIRKDEVIVIDSNKNTHYVNLDKGQRFGNGGGVSYRGRDNDKIKVGDIVQYANSNTEYQAKVIDIVFDTPFRRGLSSVKIQWLDNGKIEKAFLEDLMLSKKFNNGGGVDSMMRSRRGM